MKNIIKAQLYQISKMRVLLLVLMGALGFAFLFGVVERLNGANSLSEGQLMTASDYCTRAGAITTFILIFMSIFTAFICADDFGDKTANYEILTGTLRWKSFFARAILAVVFSTLLGLVMIVTDIVTYTAVCGWGNSIPVSAALKRLALTAFPLARLNCLFVLMAFICKKTFLVPVLEFSMNIICGFLNTGASGSVFLTSQGTLQKLFSFDAYCNFGLANGTRIIYEPYLDTRTVIMSIAASVFFSALYLAVGCSLYHRDDLD